MRPAVDGAGCGSAAEDFGELLAAAIPPLVEQLVASRPGRVYRDVLGLLERPLLERALALTGGNQLRAARLLGLNRNTLRKRCRQLGLLHASASPLRTVL